MRDLVLSLIPLMRELSEETMLSWAEQYDLVTTRDAIGGVTTGYVKVDEYRCGLKLLEVAERPNFTGVDVTVTAIARFPAEKIYTITSASRFTIYTDGFPHTFDIVGPVHKGVSSVVVELSRVQEYG